jgi:hypothetical protein
MPGLQEQYERVQTNQPPNVRDPTIPLRVDVAQPGDEIVEIRYQRIQKGSYPQFAAMTVESIWPWEESATAIRHTLNPRRARPAYFLSKYLVSGGGWPFRVGIRCPSALR